MAGEGRAESKYKEEEIKESRESKPLNDELK